MSNTRFDLMRSVIRERINEVATYAADDPVAADWLDMLTTLASALKLAAQDMDALTQMVGESIGRGRTYGSPGSEFRYSPTLQTLQAEHTVPDTDLKRYPADVIAREVKYALTQSIVAELEMSGRIEFKEMPKDATRPHTTTWRATLRVEAKTAQAPAPKQSVRQPFIGFDSKKGEWF